MTKLDLDRAPFAVRVSWAQAFTTGFLAALMCCSPSPESTKDSNEYGGHVEFIDDDDETEGTSVEPEVPLDPFLVESRPFDHDAFDSLENPNDLVYDDDDSIRELFQRWTGVALPKSAEMLSYVYDLKPNKGEAWHHLSFSVSKEVGAELLRDITRPDNQRFHEVLRSEKDIEIAVKPLTGNSVKLAKETSYMVQLQPRWAGDDELYTAIDLETGQVYCHRLDD